MKRTGRTHRLPSAVAIGASLVAGASPTGIAVAAAAGLQTMQDEGGGRRSRFVD